MRPARRRLRSGYSVSPLINGGWQLSAGHQLGQEGATGSSRALDDLLALADAGLTTFDCADIYTGVEALYGRLLKRRPDVQIHTKYVPDLDALPTLDAAAVRRGIERSLSRLAVERLDLVQFHWWDFAVDGWLDAAGTLDELRREGKIRLLGVTNFDTPRLRRLLDAGVEIAAHQVQYSLLDRRPERAMVRLCEERDVWLLCYGTLAGGFLSGRHLGVPAPAVPSNRSLVKYRLIIDEMGGWSVFQELLRLVAEIAAEHGASPANVASAWVLSRPRVAAAIVGVRNAAHLADNLRTPRLSLDTSALERLAAFLERHPGPKGEVYGLEREPQGRHAVIMKTGLNAGAEG